MDLVCLQTINSNQGAVRAVRFNVDGSYCLTCGSDKKVKLWNPNRNLLLKTYGGHGGEVHDACGSSENSHIVSCGADKTVILWDVATGQALRRFRAHAGRVSCVKFNEDSSVAVSGSQDNTVIFWDIKGKSQNPIQVLRDAKDCISTIQIVESEIYTSSFDGFLRCYDIRAGRLTADYLGESITYLSLTRDAQCFVVSTADERIILLDKTSGELLAEFSGHQSHDFLIENCMNCKDNVLLSGSADGKVYCWDLISQKIVATLDHVPGKAVHSISPHPTIESYLTATGGTVHLWGMKTSNDDDDV